MLMRLSMMPIHDGDELKIVVLASVAPEHQHQVIVIASAGEHPVRR
jgi:hypothetical protein